MPLIKVTDKSKKITDTLLISQLEKQGIYQDEVQFSQDYAMPAVKDGIREKGKSPYVKFYKHLNSPSQFMVSSGLPMCDYKGQLLDVGFIADSGGYRSKTNVFDSFVTLDGQVTAGCLNDQPDGRKSGQISRWSPVLYLGKKQIKPSKPKLLEIDPINENYKLNVLEWDYGICKRRIRLIEGHTLGTWEFPTNPNGDVRIVYNQSGDFLVKLGMYAVNPNEERIPLDVFNSAQYPFTVGDSQTFYPDADAETSSVDSYIYRQSVDETWGTITSSDGTTANPSTTSGYPTGMASSATSDQWSGLYRGIYLFDTSGLSDDATITGAVFSIRGTNKADTLSVTPDINIYSSNPASNTAVASGDFDTIGSTAFCDTPITYAGWVTNNYNDFTLNASGIAAIPISPAGACAKFGARNANYDVTGTPPSWTGSKYSRLGGYFSEQGAGYKPKLVVTYVVPVSITISLAATADASSAQSTPVGIVQADIPSAMPATSAFIEPALDLISNPTISLSVPMAATSAMTTPTSIVTAIMASVMESTGLCIEPVLNLISNPTITLEDVMASTGAFTEPALSLSLVIELTDVMRTGDGITYYGTLKRWSGSEWLPVTKVRMWSE